MKFIVGFIFTVTICALATTAQNVFVKTFRDLHRGPPPPPAGSSGRAVAVNWIEQKLDHFDDSETKTWQMRYLSNDEYFIAGGPIFIFVGGEWEVSSGYLTTGHMHDMAKEHNGYLFYTEHRYYGQSRPTDDLRLESLKYLNVRQALADLVHFIKTVKSTINGLENSKVILTGGSYSASMVAWFKVIYPDLIVGAWASSAPLFAKVDFLEYKEVTGRSIRLIGGEACYNRIQNGMAELESMIANQRVAELKAMLKICDNFDESNQLDVWTLFGSLSNIFAGIVQYHSNGDIENTCNTIMQGEDDVGGLATFILLYLGISTCQNVTHEGTLSYLMDTSYFGDITRQWYYQICNGFGWFQTSTSNAQPFGSNFPVEYYVNICTDVFGGLVTNDTIYKNAEDINALFGGWNPPAENVYYTHGELDPWSAMGITEKDRATVIPSSAHCADLESIGPRDTAEMRASKERIAELVREWVSDDTKS